MEDILASIRRIIADNGRAEEAEPPSGSAWVKTSGALPGRVSEAPGGAGISAGSASSDRPLSAMIRRMEARMSSIDGSPGAGGWLMARPSHPGIIRAS